MIRKEELRLTTEWDKTFPMSSKVEHSKVTFVNRYGITLAADMYVPKDAEGKLPAIAVSGPFGAVKEQCSGLYAQTMAERGFVTLAFDPSYTGESGGEPRYMASPDINTEDFMAAVDLLSMDDRVDPEHIGIIGVAYLHDICCISGQTVAVSRRKPYTTLIVHTVQENHLLLDGRVIIRLFNEPYHIIHVSAPGSICCKGALCI